jgi:hypothetical protein
MRSAKGKRAAGAWVRFVEKGPLRIQVEAWYNRQQNKNAPVVRKILDLAHWDFSLDFYTVDHLLTKYEDPQESDVIKALIECGYPPHHAEQRASQQELESMGLSYRGGHHAEWRNNPASKYLDRVYRFHGQPTA